MCLQSLWQSISSLKVAFLLDLSPANISLGILLTRTLHEGNLLRGVGQSNALSSPGTLKEGAACIQPEKNTKPLKQTSELQTTKMWLS